MEVPAALDRQVRRDNRELPRIQAGNETAAARLHAGDQPV